MEVDKTAFWGRLLDILVAISDAHFVSFDLEMSGIPTKALSSKKMSLEERYLDIKAAADRYAILQIGLTCVKQDLDTESYTARPYNFNLSPLLEKGLNLERIWSFQSGAAEFLLGHGFQMDLPMTKGVPYLSREEAKKAKELAYARWDGSSFADVQLKENEAESLEFMSKVRIAINKWVKTGKPHSSSLNIDSVDPTSEQPRIIADLGNFERRLVHQLVRAEYPDLISFTRNQSVQIKFYDEEREKKIMRGRKRTLRGQIEQQTGFRWIIEALCGGELKIDPQSFARVVETGAASAADMIDLKARFDDARLRLQRKRPVLVGHNLFTDIIYLYRTFIGHLPPTLEEFRECIHDHFPLVVDTKYMATHNCGDINPRSSLEEIHNKLRGQARPVIVTHADHSKYHDAESFHEAGYDSFMTALIMIRLSTKLEAEGAYLEDVSPSLSNEEGEEEEEESYVTAPEDTVSDGRASPHVPKNSQGIISVNVDGTTELTTPPMAFSEDWNTNGAPLAHEGAPPDNTEPTRRKKANRKKHKDGKSNGHDSGSPTKNNGSGSKFTHKNMFAQLMDLDGDDEDDEGGTGSLLRGGSGKQPVATIKRDGTTYYTYEPAESKMDKDAEVDREGTEQMTWMPPFESEFWQTYGNKLRAFGTQEGVWRLQS